jgi:hypothetical protein
MARILWLQCPDSSRPNLQITRQADIPAICRPLLGFPRTKRSQRSHSFANCMLLLAHSGKRVLASMLGQFLGKSVTHTYDILPLSAACQFCTRRESHQLTRASRAEIGRSIRPYRSTAPDLDFHHPRTPSRWSTAGLLLLSTGENWTKPPSERQGKAHIYR